MYHGPEVVYGIPLEGLIFREWKAKASVRWQQEGFDGCYLDHWDDPWWGDTPRFTAREYRDGMSKMAARIRELWPGLILIGNPGTSIESSYDLNGFMWEDYPEFSGSVDRELRVVARWESTGSLPRMFIMNQRELKLIPRPNPKTKQSGFWQRMRYATGISLLQDDIYLMFNYGRGGSPHWAVPWWFDEWSVQLGQPLGKKYKLTNGVFARKFKQGIVLGNATAHTQVVTRQQLGGETYYRFLGSQQPDFNNGMLFDQVTLVGWSNNENTAGDWTKPIGDAIILVKSPQRIVSEILLDDEGNSETPILINIQGRFESNGMVFDPGKYQYWTDAWRVHGHSSCFFADGKDANLSARWVPEIGISGKYEVFEWHPTSREFATNAPYKIKHARGETTVRINQRTRGNQWNSLGTYLFNRGGKYYIQVSNQAYGTVVADAVKLVYRGTSQNNDTIPPQAPRNVRLKE